MRGTPNERGGPSSVFRAGLRTLPVPLNGATHLKNASPMQIPRTLAIALALALGAGAAHAQQSEQQARTQQAHTQQQADTQQAGMQQANTQQAGAQAGAQGDTMTAPQVRAALESQGYTGINDVEFDDGLWKADARSADGQRVELRIDPASGKVYPDDGVSRLGESDVRARLAAAGYAKVHDVEFDDGVWTAEADDANGREVKLTLDPEDGRVIGEARD